MPKETQRQGTQADFIRPSKNDPYFDGSADLPAKGRAADLPAITSEMHQLKYKIQEKLEAYKKEKGHHADRATAVMKACDYATSIDDFRNIIQSQLDLFSDISDKKQNFKFSKKILSAFKKNSLFSFFGASPTDYLTKPLENKSMEEGWHKALASAMELIKSATPAANSSSSPSAAPKR